MSQFEFAAPGRIVFGPGTLKEAGPAAAALGRRALVVTNRTVERAKPLLALLAESRVEAVTCPAAGEPTMDDVRRAVARSREHACDLVIGIGGGSALDLAKAAAAVLANGGDALDYAEVIGRARAITKPSVPWMAIPTTAGSGAEATKNAVIASPEHGVKVSFRSPLMLARVAIVDPELTAGLPSAVTAATGLDALTQLIEAFTCTRANPMTDGLCREGLARSARSLRRACRPPEDPAARADLALASFLSGLALSNAGLGAVHAIAGPFGGAFRAPHGAVCARLLPEVMAANVRALASRPQPGEALARYDEVARLVTGSPEAAAADGVGWVRALVGELGIPGLSHYGLTPEGFPALVEKSLAASSMKANPVKLTTGELQEILERAL